MGFHSTSCCRLLFFFPFTLILVSLVLCVTSAAALDVQASDCIKCHTQQIKELIADGSKHATEVACLECHPLHLPKSTETITACVACHEGHAHYEVGDCKHCHMDPHLPMTRLRDPLKPVRVECLSCHEEVGRAMVRSPSRHAVLFCNRCHNHHKEIPECLDCHGAHLEEQSAADCLRCHQAHQPLQVVSSGYIPLSYCRICHGDVARDLADTNTNHGGLNCTYCHKGEHSFITACQNCHGLPHAPAIHGQYRKCLECHVDAHKLVSHP